MKVTKRRHKIIGSIKNMKNKKITRKTRSMGYINDSKGTKKMESMGYINNRKSRKRRNIRKSKKRRTIIKHRKSKKNAGVLGERKEKLGKTIANLEIQIEGTTRIDKKVELEEKLQALREKYANIEAQINARISDHLSLFRRNELVKLCDELFKKFEEKKILYLTPLNNKLIDYRNIEVKANEKKAELTGEARRTIISIIKIQLADVIDNLRNADSIALPAHETAVITAGESDFFNLSATLGDEARRGPTTITRRLEYTNFMEEIYLNGYENGTRLNYSNTDDANFYYDLIDRIDKKPDFSNLKTYLETYISTEIPADSFRITHELKGTEGDPYHIFKFYEHDAADDDDLFHLTIHITREVRTTDHIDKFTGGKIHLKKSDRDADGKYVQRIETCTNLRPYIFTKIPGRDLIGPNKCLQFIPIYPKYSADYATLADKLKLVIVKGVNKFIFKNQIDDAASTDTRVKDAQASIYKKQTDAQEFFTNYINTLSNRSIMLGRNLIRRDILFDNEIKDNLEEFTKFIKGETETGELDKNLFEKCSDFQNILKEINNMMLDVKTLINDVTIEEADPTRATIERLNKDARDNYGEFLDGDGDFLTNLETISNNALANPEQIVREDRITPFNTHVDRLNEAIVNLKLAATTRNTPGAETSEAAVEEPIGQPVRPSKKKPVDEVVQKDKVVQAALRMRKREEQKTKKGGRGKRLNKITRKKIK